MKIAALYDIHGNLPALDAVLEELKEVQPDLIVVGGDIVSGPLPGPTLERLIQFGDQVRFLRGNNDREVVMAADGVPLRPEMSDKGREVMYWVATQLTRSQRDFLGQLPEQIILHVEGLGDVLFCHATPDSDEEIFTPLTSPERLTAIFAGVEQQMVICGHTHIQFERQVGSVRVLNAGSIGMPYADRPGAYWLLLSSHGSEFRWTAYDGEAAARAIRASGYPLALDFAETNVLKIPTAAEAAEILERMAKAR